MAGRALFFLCDESLLSEALEKIKPEVSEANDRLFLFQPAPWKSASPTNGRTSNLLTLSLSAGTMEVRRKAKPLGNLLPLTIKIKWPCKSDIYEANFISSTNYFRIN
jgi:hypothetical protein